MHVRTSQIVMHLLAGERETSVRTGTEYLEVPDVERGQFSGWSMEFLHTDLCRVGNGCVRAEHLAFIFIGLQIRPILDSLEAAERGRYFAVAGAVVLTVIVVRIAWHMSFNAASGGDTAGSGFIRHGCCGRPLGAA